jgi:hypothetical protein
MASEYEHPAAVAAFNEFLQTFGEEADAIYQTAVRNYAMTLYDAALSRTGKKYFLDKTPRYYFIIDDLRQLFPQAKFIILLRNPLAVLASILTTWFKLDTEKLAKSYSYIDLINGPAKLVSHMRQSGAESLVVSYEELVADPDSTVQELCNRLGVGFDRDIINYGRSNEVMAGRFGDQVGVGKHLRPVQDYRDKWKEVLKPDEINRFARNYLESLGDDVIDGLGYSFHELNEALEQIAQ